jgi:predicted ribosome quality control (RQC) complex YloA/Tae2 family protein
LIYNGKPAVFYNDKLNEIHIGFDHLLIFSTFQKELFDDIFKAFNSYFNKKYYFEKKQIKFKKISATLEREIKKLTSRLNNLKVVLNHGCKEEELKRIGNILLINLSKIKSSSDEIELEDIYDDQKKIKVRLNPKFSPHQNADYYFTKARADRINFEKSTKLYSDAMKEIEKLKAIENKLSDILTLEQLEEIMKEMKIKDQIVESLREDLSSKFKHYLIQGKYHVYVGKDSQNNDLLTTKFAKQNDYWFHARSVSGSHVILKIENTKEAIPKNIIKCAAALAAYHSKAKTSGLAPVSYTFKKYVIKRKGMPIGQVSLTKEEVLLVKPEIPANCVYMYGE